MPGKANREGADLKTGLATFDEERPRIGRRDVIAGATLGAAAALFAVCEQSLIALGILAAASLGWWLLASARRWPSLLLITTLMLPPLPLPWGDSGVHVAPFVAAMGLWAGLLRPGEWRIRLGGIAGASLLLVVVLASTVPFAAIHSSVEVAAGSLARVGLLAISVYLFLYLAYGPGRGIDASHLIRVLFWAGFGSAAFATVDFYFQFPAPARFAEQMVWLSGGIYRRAQGVFYEASTLGLLCVFLLVFAACSLTTEQSKSFRPRTVWLAASIPVFLSALIFSFSRAAVINLAAALAVVVWLPRGGARSTARGGRVLLTGSLGLICGIALAAYLFPEYLDAYVARLQRSGEFLFSEPNMVLSRRLDSWQLLAGYITDHPWSLLAGIGYKTLPYVEFMGRQIVADNMYLSLLIETGLPGLFALLLLCAAILSRSLRQASSEPPEVRRFCGRWMFAFWTGLMLQMISGDILTYWRLLPAFFTVLAIGARDDDPVPGSV